MWKLDKPHSPAYPAGTRPPRSPLVPKSPTVPRSPAVVTTSPAFLLSQGRSTAAISAATQTSPQSVGSLSTGLCRKRRCGGSGGSHCTRGQIRRTWGCTRPQRSTGEQLQHGKRGIAWRSPPTSKPSQSFRRVCSSPPIAFHPIVYPAVTGYCSTRTLPSS